MRKTILLLAFLVSAVTFTSCNKDDSPSGDPIIGTWTHIEEYENGVSYQLDKCDLKDTVIFAADGTFTGKYYEAPNGSDCIESITTGTWKNEGDDNYKLTIGNESNTTKVTFSGDTFSFEGKDGNDTYKSVYKRK